MSIEKAQEFLLKVQEKGSILGMESIRRLCGKLNNPEEYGKIIHIAGTNGKGSTGKLLEQALRALGYRVGRYSSPAVFSHEEIIQVNGESIPKEAFAQLILEVKDACDSMERDGFACPTAFEVETAAAFLYFKKQKCEFSIIEVGMGGRTDATNVLMHPVASVITSISLDHTGFLGKTLPEIAFMKAGIIKKDGVVIKLRQTEEINRVFTEEMKKVKGSTKELFWADKEEYPILAMSPEAIEIKDGNDSYRVGVSGIYQQENIAVALTTLKALERAGELSFSENREKVKEAFLNICWQGRMETVFRDPLLIIDGCHNPDAAVKLRKTMDLLFAGRKIHFVIGVLKDKDYPRIFEQVLPLGVSAYCVTPPGIRGLAASELAKLAKNYLPEVECFDCVADAVETALKKCTEKEDMVFAFGSLSYLGEVKQYADGICKSPDKE